MRSTDGGATWNPANGTGPNVLPVASASKIELTIAPSSPTTLYAGVSNGSLLGLYKTTDSGANWTKLTNTPIYCNACDFANVVRVSPVNANIVFAGGLGMARSLDGGATWDGTVGNSVHVDHHALAFAADGSKLYDGNDGGCRLP